MNAPIPARIILPLKRKVDSGEDIIGLSTTLYRQGLIYGEPRELRRNEDELILIVIFSDQYAFDHWLENEAVVQYWRTKLQDLLQSEPVTKIERDVILEVDKVKNCNCEDSGFFLLSGRRMLFIGGLFCGDCLGIIPDYKIPRNIELEAWHNNYERVYSIWLASGTLEEWACEELSNYKNGALNLEGQRIRKALELYLKRPVFLEYFEEEPSLEPHCLICGFAGEESGLKRPNRVCLECRTAF